MAALDHALESIFASRCMEVGKHSKPTMTGFVRPNRKMIFRGGL